MRYAIFIILLSSAGHSIGAAELTNLSKRSHPLTQPLLESTPLPEALITCVLEYTSNPSWKIVKTYTQSPGGCRRMSCTANITPTQSRVDQIVIKRTFLYMWGDGQIKRVTIPPQYTFNIQELESRLPDFDNYALVFRSGWEILSECGKAKICKDKSKIIFQELSYNPGGGLTSLMQNWSKQTSAWKTSTTYRLTEASLS